jgi:hypothetical protein
VEKDNADDVVYARLYGDANGTFLLIHETIFQAAIKRSEGNMIRTIGYSETRVSVYDIQTGHLKVRKPFGVRREKGTTVLGIHDGLVWIFSLDSDLGLHARDLRTLEIKVTQDQILEKNQNLQSNLALPEWYRIPKYYAYDEIREKLIVTDNQGHRYFIDPQNLLAAKISDSFRLPTKTFRDFSDHSLPFKGKRLWLSGSLRKILQLGRRPLAPDLSFLDGKLLVDSNLARVFQRLKKQYQHLQQLHNSLDKKWQDRNFDSRRMSSLSPEEYRLCKDLRMQRNEVEREYKQVERIYKYWASENRFSIRDRLLMPYKKSFLVAHRSSVANDGRLVISLLQFQGENKVTEKWQTTLGDLFFDPNKARETDPQRTVFSKGNPSFNFKFLDFTSNKLVLVYMLHALCLDLKTGKILWKFRI